MSRMGLVATGVVAACVAHPSGREDARAPTATPTIGSGSPTRAMETSSTASSMKPRRSAEDSVALMTACYRGVNPQVQPLERTDVYCSTIYRRPACAKAWLDMSLAFTTPSSVPYDEIDGRSRLMPVVEHCRAEYCPGASDTPALCSASATLDKENVIELVAWLLDQELTFPHEQSQKWARGAFMSLWLQSPR